MAKSGPQQYPGASLKYDWSERYPGSPMESNVICWHSTEGMSVPNYGGGGSAPNFTVAPDFKNKRAQWYQHFDFDESSRALVNLGGGVQTNTANVCQIEIVGTCDPKHKTSWSGKKAGVDYIYTPTAPKWFLDELAEFSAWANKAHKVRLAAKRPNGSALVFKAYPSSYGTKAQNDVRLTGAEWDEFYGHCGHQHVPENLHGDPGNIDIAYILDKATQIVGGGGGSGATKPPTTSKPKYEPFPGANFFKDGRKSPIILAMRKRFIAVGCNKYQSTSNPDTWGSGDEASYAAWQRKCGFSGADANGIPGKSSWDDLKVPNV
ncbi:endolysin [Streptomyces phage Keanu]|nr:endolysin [Streptomyces phage Keanu]